jgi:hypothetical protein
MHGQDESGEDAAQKKEGRGIGDPDQGCQAIDRVAVHGQEQQRQAGHKPEDRVFLAEPALADELDDE